jgi:hypothetical protein
VFGYSFALSLRIRFRKLFLRKQKGYFATRLLDAVPELVTKVVDGGHEKWNRGHGFERYVKSK